MNRLPSQVSENPLVVSTFQHADQVEPTSIFVFLGPLAAPAVPELTILLNDTNNFDLVHSAAFCLAAVGDAGLPPLLAALANQKHPSCYSTAYWLGNYGLPFTFSTNFAKAVPLLIQCTTAADQRLAEAATKAIGRIHQEPQIAIPALENCLTSKNPMLRRAALRSLAGFGKPGIPHIVSRLLDSDEPVRRTATNLITLIAPEVLTNTPAP